MTTLTASGAVLPSRRALRAQEARDKRHWSDRLVVPTCVALPFVPSLFVELLNKAMGAPYKGSVTKLIAHSLWIAITETPPATAIIMMVLIGVCVSTLVVYFHQAATFTPYRAIVAPVATAPAPYDHPLEGLAVTGGAYRQQMASPW